MTYERYKFLQRNQERGETFNEVSSHQYQVVASDLIELDGHSHLLVVDCYSKWPRCCQTG